MNIAGEASYRAEDRASSSLDLSVVIPAFNEEATVQGVVAGHREIAARLTSLFEIIVCDDGSTDRTYARLEEAQSRVPELVVVRNVTNIGIPATLRRLYSLARADWVYFAPADGQVPASALEQMWPHRVGASLVVGRRVPRRDPLGRVLMAELYSAVLRRIFRLPVHDIDSVKLYRADDLRSVRTSSHSNFLEAEILISLCRARRVVREVIVEHRPRIAGRAKGVTAGSALRAMIDLALFVARDAVASPRRTGGRAKGRRERG